MSTVIVGSVSASQLEGRVCVGQIDCCYKFIVLLNNAMYMPIVNKC